MTDALWWLPSVIVLGVVVGVIWLFVSASRRKGRSIRAAETAETTERARTAAISLVRADDLIEAATDELGFAQAQFGERATADFAAALDVSKRQLREAFALQQKLDDGVPDTDTQIRQWTEQITRLADEATGRLNAQTREFDSKRVVEQNAPVQLEQLRRRLDRATDRLAGGAATLDRLATTYSASALAAISGNVERARTAIDEGRRAADAADARLATGATDPVGDQVSAAEHGLFTATTLLDAIETGEDQLHVAFASLGTALAGAETELAEARALRDRHEESEASTELNRVIAAADAVVAELRRPGRVSDPAADLARLREALDGLDVTRSEARNRQLRLDNAREAFVGARLAARSQIGITRDFITANRGRVGADARTRLAEAERQLALAEAEADPVTALDAARRAMTHATDADALAHYDAR
ncbi:hypothetical protein [Cryobacterium arcticum]|uniref:TPM domain-containing protein n=1 Tax=Cryobacterium arcticum TaxID=670052 RepID=A0A1B1BMX9_9MICO|nr:hypothetical protein [Cryobacterium arcticum]ANP73970.1 hypothetical protein PA27867_3034 [Cryobacterium arcticum]